MATCVFARASCAWGCAPPPVNTLDHLCERLWRVGPCAPPTLTPSRSPPHAHPTLTPMLPPRSAPCLQANGTTSEHMGDVEEDEEEDEEVEVEDGAGFAGSHGLQVVAHHPTFGPLVQLNGQLVPLMMLMQLQGAAGSNHDDEEGGDDDMAVDDSDDEGDGDDDDVEGEGGDGDGGSEHDSAQLQ